MCARLTRARELLRLSSEFFLNRSIWQSYKQERGWRGCLTHFAHLANTMLKDEESARDNHVMFVILPVICRFKKSLTESAINLS